MQAYTDIYFSPHLDDVVLSCGGRIARGQHDGQRALVVTAFSGGSNQAEKLADKALDPFADMERRRQEDERAMNRLGVDHLWLGYDEAIYRDQRYGSLIGMTSQVLESDSKLCEALWSDILKICHQAKGAQLYFPLGVGHHVDHQILFEVGATIEDKERLDGQIRYYEDVPYAFIPGLLRLRMKLIGAAINPLPPDLRGQWILTEIMKTYRGVLGMRMIRANITAAQRPLLFLHVLHLYVLRYMLMNVRLRARRREREHRLRPEVVDVTEHLQAKLDAVCEYRSQVTALLGDGEAFRKDMEKYSASVMGKGGCYVERYWRANGRET